MKFQMTENDYLELFKWVPRATGHDLMPCDSPEHMRALIRLFQLCGDELIFLRENPLEASFAGYIFDHRLDVDLPQTNAAEQEEYLVKCHELYCEAFRDSLIFKPKSLDDAICEAVFDFELSPLLILG